MYLPGVPRLLPGPPAPADVSPPHPRIDMSLRFPVPVRALLAPFLALSLSSTAAAQQPAAGARPMTFLDVQEMRSVGSPEPSPDGRWMLYTITTPDWEEARSQRRLSRLPAAGPALHPPMTFTGKKNETSPAWGPDGSWFVFRSDRDAARATAARTSSTSCARTAARRARSPTRRTGWRDFALQPATARWLVYRAGKAGEQQLWRLPWRTCRTAHPGAAHEATWPACENWAFAPDSRAHLVRAPRHASRTTRPRREKKFTVDIKNDVTPLASLWCAGPDAEATEKAHGQRPLLDGLGLQISPDGKWVGFTRLLLEALRAQHH